MYEKNHDEDFAVFNQNVTDEKERIINADDLFPPKNTEDCVYVSAIPWVNFTGHKEPFHGKKESVPRIAFSKMELINNKKMNPNSFNIMITEHDGFGDH